jgi:hypothetical protein
MIFPAAQVLAPVHGVEIGVEDADHKIIGAVIIVAVARCAVEQHLSLALEAREIGSQDVQ